jgi:diacylglycerol kinase (ATP)
LASPASDLDTPPTPAPPIAPTRPARRIVRSFRFAFAGLRVLLWTQPNTWVHVALAALALTLSFLLRLSAAEFALVILTIGLVLAVEAVNTAIESVCDLVSPGYHPLVKRAKDLSAAAVLISAIAAVGIAIALFVPRLLRGL